MTDRQTERGREGLRDRRSDGQMNIRKDREEEKRDRGQMER